MELIQGDCNTAIRDVNKTRFTIEMRFEIGTRHDFEMKLDSRFDKTRSARNDEIYNEIYK